MIGSWLNEILQMGQAHWQIALLLKTSLVLMGVWLLTHCAKKASASQKHMLWSLGLGAALILPLWQAKGPKLPLEILPENNRILLETQQPAPTFEEVRVEAQTENSQILSQASVSFHSPQNRGSLLKRCLFWTYATVASGFLFHLIIGLMGVMSLTRRARRLTDSAALRMVALITQQLGIKKHPVCLVSTRVNMPFTWGFFRPKIILPSTFLDWPESTQRNVLTHEMAHVRRGDWLTGTLARISMILYWVNPLSWKALARFRLEAERACDDLVLNLGNPATEYADQLLGFVGQANRHPYSGVAMTTMAFRSDFSERMLSILNSKNRRHSFKLPHLCGSIFLALSFTSFMGGIELRSRSTNTVLIKGDMTANEDGKTRTSPRWMVEGLRSLRQNVSDAFSELNLSVNEEDRALLNAVRSGNIKLILQLLESGADVNQPIFGDGSALIQAAHRGDLSIAKLLLEAGADVNLGVRGDGSPLQVAVSRRNHSLVDLFLEFGADPNLGVRGDGNPLIAAAKKGDITLAERLLEKNADIDGFVQGDETPLIQAIQAKKFDMAIFLIEQGADVNKAVPTDDEGELISPMSIAKERAPQAIIDLLIQHGALDHEP